MTQKELTRFREQLPAEWLLTTTKIPACDWHKLAPGQRIMLRVKGEGHLSGGIVVENRLSHRTAPVLLLAPFSGEGTALIKRGTIRDVHSFASPMFKLVSSPTTEASGPPAATAC